MLEPYRHLAKGKAPATETISVEASSTPITSLFSALRRKYIFHASVAFGAILAEVLTVLLPVIPFHSSTSYRAWKVSTYLSVAILFLMILTLISVFVRRKSPRLPRQPHTLAAVISYVFSSRMSHELHPQWVWLGGWTQISGRVSTINMETQSGLTRSGDG